MTPEKNKIPVALRMSDQLHRDLRVHCIQKGIKVQDFVERVISKALEKESYVKQR